jgi:hypothetical protein
MTLRRFYYPFDRPSRHAHRRLHNRIGFVLHRFAGCLQRLQADGHRTAGSPAASNRVSDERSCSERTGLWRFSPFLLYGRSRQFSPSELCNGRGNALDLPPTAINDFFLSASTFFTLESGRPLNSLSRLLSAAE